MAMVQAEPVILAMVQVEPIPLATAPQAQALAQPGLPRLQAPIPQTWPTRPILVSIAIRVRDIDLSQLRSPLIGSDGRRGYDSSNTSGGYGSGTTGQGLTGRETGSSGYGSTVGEHGHHGRHGQVEDIVHGGEHYTETANKLDPHVSGGDNTSSGYGARSEGTGGYGSGSGTGDGTSGPHKSSLLNKVDPRSVQCNTV